MFLATSNPARQLLCVSYSDEVRPEDLARNRENLRSLLAGLAPGFRLLVDLSLLKVMALECQTEIGGMMEDIGRSGVSLVVRVIPDESKDIGFKILSVFHYPTHPKTVTCRNLMEAARALEL